MATFYVKNSVYPDNPQLFTITVQQLIKRQGEPDTDFPYDMRGEEYWEVHIETSGLDSSGNSLGAFWTDVKGSEVSINEMIGNKVEEICSVIDWSSQGQFSEQIDRYPPISTSHSPIDGSSNVPIKSPIKVVLKERLPGSGIDISTLSFKVKGIPVAPTVIGTPFEYTLSFSPQPLD